MNPEPEVTTIRPRRTSLENLTPLQPQRKMIKSEIISTPTEKLVNFISLLLSLLEFLLFARVILKSINMNTNHYVLLLYNITFPFITPFLSLFPAQNNLNGGYLESATIFAIVSYSLISWILTILSNFLVIRANNKVSQE